MSDNKNMLIAILLAALIMGAWQYFYEWPRQQERARLAAQQAQSESKDPAAATTNSTGNEQPVALPQGAGGNDAAPAAIPGTATPETLAASREAALAATPRLPIRGQRLKGSLPLKGLRIDDLILPDYRETQDPDSPPIKLLSPSGSAKPYYAQFGWTAAPGSPVRVPGPDSVWTPDRPALETGQPLILSWDNGEGVVFKRIIELDENYMFSVSLRVENNSGKEIRLFPYGLVARHGKPKVLGYYILHEGMLGVLNEELQEETYDDLAEAGAITKTSTGGWVGITDKYWLTALIPDQKRPIAGSFKYRKGQREIYQADFIAGKPDVIADGGNLVTRNLFFAGAKEVKLLDRYNEKYGIQRFDLAIDWGYFYFLTRPIFFAIDFLYGIIGNFGLAIIAFTFFVKLLFLPLAHKSYVSMSKMKMLQPKIAELRERCGDDRQKLNQEMMELYKREKVNPVSGCLPILLQIPVFFSLYKVLFVTIEMRHAPFFGWIHDLSAPDPTNIFTLFGLIPWTPPSFLHLGILPLIMGITMYLQQKLNPQPADPVQAKIMTFMPIMFTFLLAGFPAGLVLYWTTNNVLTIIQQWFIMKRVAATHGATPK